MNWSRLPEISSSPLPESDCLLCMKVFQWGTVRDDCDFHWWRIWWWLTHIGSCNLLHAVSAGCICCSFKSIIIALPSTFPFEIKCVTLQRANICSGTVAGLLSRPARMAIIGHLGQFNCSALSSGQKQQKKTNWTVCGEKNLYHTILLGLSTLCLSVWEVSSFSMWKCASFSFVSLFLSPIQQDLLLTLAKTRKIKQKIVVRVFNEKKNHFNRRHTKSYQSLLFTKWQTFLLALCARSLVRLPYRAWHSKMP